MSIPTNELYTQVRDGDFRQELLELVSRNISGLTSSHSVDEANGDVLDKMISHAVLRELASIERQLTSRGKHLQEREQHLSSEHHALVGELEHQRNQRSAHDWLIRDLMSKIAATAEAVDTPPGLAVDAQHLRAFIREQRAQLTAIQEAALATGKVPSGSQLSGARDAAERGLESAERDLESKRQRQAEADANLTDALANLRGRAQAVHRPMPEESAA